MDPGALSHAEYTNCAFLARERTKSAFSSARDAATQFSRDQCAKTLLSSGISQLSVISEFFPE